MEKSPTKNVLLLTDVTAPGGVDSYTTHLYRAAIDAGWKVGVLMDQLAGSDQLHGMLTALGAEIMRGPLYHRQFAETERAAAAEAALQRFQPTVVHAICGAPWTTIVPREVVLSRDLPLVFVEQYVAPDFTFADDTRQRIVSLYQRASAVIAVSHQNASLLTNTYGFPGKKLEVIPNFVAAGTTTYNEEKREEIRRRLDLPPSRYNAVTVARHSPQKGIDVLLKAMALLAPAVRAKVHVTLIGDGPLRPELEVAAARDSLADCVTFLGWRDDVVELLPAFDFFLLPSRSEGQPFALLEALAAGLPAIATAVSGIPEALENGKVGELVPSENPSALAAAITAFIQSPEALFEKAQRAREWIRRHYNLTTNTTRTMELWEAALQRGRTKTA